MSGRMGYDVLSVQGSALEAARALLERTVGPGAVDAHLRAAVCALQSSDGDVAGVSWAVADDVALVGGRRFWIYGSALAGEPGEASDLLLAETFLSLERAFDAAARGPMGLCLVTRDPAEMARRPDAQWTDPPMTYAGFSPDGAQLRVAYFAGAQI